MSSLINKSAWSAVSTVSLSLARFLVSIIVARKLGVQEMGALVYLLWLSELAMLLTSLGLQNSLTRFLAELGGRGELSLATALERYLSRFFLVLLLLSLPLAIFVAPRLLHNTLKPEIWVLWCLLFLTQGFSTLYLAQLVGRQYFAQLAKLNLLSGFLLLIGVFWGCHSLSLAGGLLGYLLSYLPAATLGVRRFLQHKTAPALDEALRHRLWRYALQTWIAAIVSAIIWSRSEIFFIEHYWSTKQVAFFTVGLSLASFVGQLPLLLVGAFMPHFAELAGRGERERICKLYSRGTCFFALFLIPLAFILAALTPRLLPLLYGEQFHEAALPATVLVALSALGFAHVASALLYGLERSLFIAWGGLAGALLSVVSCLLLVPRYGVGGAVLARAIVQCLMVICTVLYLTFALGFSFPRLSFAKILFASLVAAIVAHALLAGGGGLIMLIISAASGAVAFVLCARLLRVLSQEDIKVMREGLASLPRVVVMPLQSFFQFIASPL